MFDCLLFCNKTYIKYISQIYDSKETKVRIGFNKKRNKGNPQPMMI